MTLLRHLRSGKYWHDEFVDHWTEYLDEFRKIYIASGYAHSHWDQFRQEGIEAIEAAAAHYVQYDLLEP